MYLMRNHDVWIYVRCANSDPRIAFDRLYDLIDEAAGHGFLVRGTSFDHCSGNTLKDRIGLRSMLDAVENGRVEAVMVRDLEQISRNSYILVGVIEILRQNDVYLIIPTECDSDADLSVSSGWNRLSVTASLRRNRSA
ncbi:MAG: recombinase family protein [Subdoligranulum sp.]